MDFELTPSSHYQIESSVSVARLEALFLPCGPIARTQMRCSRGQAITVGLAVPDVVKTERDRQYATIEFKDAGAARKALRFNGRLLDQSRLVVCTFLLYLARRLTFRL